MGGVKEPKECCSARNVLWYLVFIGFAVNYMIRLNVNIAIVSMVQPRPRTNNSHTSECLLLPRNTSADLKNLEINNFTVLNNNTNVKEEEEFISERFDWNEKQQSKILGAFFWLHWVMQIPGGILGSKYGAKLVFGLANLAGVLCCFLIPTFAFMGDKYLIGLRIFQGLVTGFAWPAMHSMTARWIPPNERGKFVTSYLGSSVGAALTYPVCGFIIHKWGWELAFYVSGLAGVLWFIGWWLLVFDSPAQHPRISQQEKEYILEALGQTYAKKRAPVPWMAILTSLPVWMNILAQFGGLWGLFTLMTHSPTYFKFIHDWSIQATGLLSGLGHVLRTIWSYFSGQLGDYLLRTNKMSRTNVRKLATASCTLGQGVFMLALAFSGCNYWLAIMCLSISVALNGAVSTGPLSSIVDLSPNYASVILGIVNSTAGLVGFITPMVVGHLTFHNQTVEQWQKVFWIASGVMIGSGVMNCLLAKSDLQPWNSPNYKETNNGSELMTINEKENERKEFEDRKNGYEKVNVDIK